MKKNVMLFFTAVAVLLALFCLCMPAAAMEKDESFGHCGYIVKLKDDAPMMMSMSSEGVQWIGDGIYVANNLDAAESIDIPENIECIEPNYYITLLEFPHDEPPDDTYYNEQWYIKTIGVPAVWKRGMFGDGAKVAVIDSGLVAGHEDIDYAYVLSGHNFTDVGDAVDTSDQIGHGSVVSGIIAAQINNGMGICGIADKVELMPLKCFAPGRNATTDMVISAITMAREQGCDVINMSFGMLSYSGILEMAINQAVEEGIIITAAVGNWGKTEFVYPAAYENVIGAGSVNSSKMVSSFSQKNASVFVTAPGEDLTGLWYTNPGAYQRNNSGTSFSTPCVTAMAALAKSTDKDIATDSFKTLLINSSEDLGAPGYDTSYGHGLVNMEDFANALAKEYTIVFELDGGSFPPDTDEPKMYTVKSESIALPEPEKTGYFFDGWYGNAAFSGECHTKIPAGSVGNRTFYAKWRDAGGTNVSAVSILGYAGVREDGADIFKVEIPAGMAIPTAPSALSVILENPYAAAGEPETSDGGLTWTVTVMVIDGEVMRNRKFTIQVSNSLNHAPYVASGQEIHEAGENAAIPASYDGLVEALPYVVNIYNWFNDEDEGDKDRLTYAVTSTDTQGGAVIEGSTLSFTPAVGDANKTVAIKVKANDGQFDSGEVTVMICVGALPVSHSMISPTWAVYDKYAASANHKDINVKMLLFGNTLTAIRNSGTPLTGNDYTTRSEAITFGETGGIEPGVEATIKSTYLSGLTSGDNMLDFEFSAGDNAVLTVFVTDTAPLYSVTFNVYGVQYAIIENIREGNTVTLPLKPSWEEHTFGGWYTGENGAGTVFTSDTAVNASITVYAKWIKNTGSSAGGGGAGGGDGDAGGGDGDAGGGGAGGGGGGAGGGGGGDAGGGGLPPVPEKYNITAKAGKGGSISGSETVIEGESVTITIKPGTGYIIFAVFIDDKIVELTRITDNNDGTYSLKLDKINSNHTVRAEFILIPPPPPEDDSPEFELFADVGENAWYADAVRFVCKQGLFKGTGIGVFSPQEHMTRGMIITVLGRLADIDENQFGSPDFNDMEENAWYAPFVAWATENDIVKGYGNGLFGPNDYISREQMTLFLHRFAKWLGYDVSAGLSSFDYLHGFNDAGSVSDWAAESINWAVSIGLINGKPGNIFDPQGKATRAEVAAVMQRFITKVHTRILKEVHN